MPEAYLTFNDYLSCGTSFERAVRRLGVLALEPRDRLRALRAWPGWADRRVMMSRAKQGRTESDDGLVASVVARSKNGDTAAMELLIERYQPRVAGFVFACVGDGQAVEDLCQTIFYKMLLRLGRLKDAGKFEAWLFRIARNACFDYLRRRRLRRIFVPWQRGNEQFAKADEPPPEAGGERRLAAFRRALMQLPPKQRELVALLQDERLSYEQLAAITNSSLSAVKSRLFRARRQLQRAMRDDG